MLLQLETCRVLARDCMILHKVPILEDVVEPDWGSIDPVSNSKRILVYRILRRNISGYTRFTSNNGAA